ncbi:MAG: alpha-E domain-containing protein [Burkholderiaceae bacterium]|nr:alpha-E domain-containing protein [Sulfuritalea sp.]MCF8173835.1 alpha-E domain-containing protein [Burkholderiaceae bacterium]
MLSSTADHLYWMARSMERAESTARMLDVTYRMGLLKSSEDESQQHWSAALSISGLHGSYGEANSELTADRVLRFMALDAGNPSSIYCCVQRARENARAVRGSISVEMWETINHTWLEMRDVSADQLHGDRVSSFFDWVKERSHLSRGVTSGTMLQDDGLRFIRVGTFLERGDNTARILDVKYHILLPSLSDVGGVADYYQWSALLRSVSSLSAYRKIYQDLITPTRVAELLILRRDMPRSLAACVHEVNQQIRELGSENSSELGRQCGRLDAELQYGRIDEILKLGVHQYLTGFLSRINDIGDQVNATYFWAMRQSA